MPVVPRGQNVVGRGVGRGEAGCFEEVALDEVVAPALVGGDAELQVVLRLRGLKRYRPLKMVDGRGKIASGKGRGPLLGITACSGDGIGRGGADAGRPRRQADHRAAERPLAAGISRAR